MTFSGAVTSRPSIENVAILIAGRGISGSSRDVPSERPAAGAARQGRRTGAMLVALPGPRTPHGGDRRAPVAGGALGGGAPQKRPRGAGAGAARGAGQPPGRPPPP